MEVLLLFRMCDNGCAATCLQSADGSFGGRKNLHRASRTGKPRRLNRTCVRHQHPKVRCNIHISTALPLRIHPQVLLSSTIDTSSLIQSSTVQHWISHNFPKANKMNSPPFLYVAVFFLLSAFAIVSVNADMKDMGFVGTFEYDFQSDHFTKVVHKYKCKRWLIGGWNHYTKYETEGYEYQSTNRDSYFENNIMKIADGVCDRYTAKESYFYIKAKQNRPVELMFMKFRITSKASSGGPGLSLSLDLNEFRLSETTNKSDFDEIKMHINHQDNHSWTISLLRNGNLKKTLSFNSSGVCTNCNDNEFVGPSSNDNAVVSFTKYNNARSHYEWYTTSGSKSSNPL